MSNRQISLVRVMNCPYPYSYYHSNCFYYQPSQAPFTVGSPSEYCESLAKIKAHSKTKATHTRKKEKKEEITRMIYSLTFFSSDRIWKRGFSCQGMSEMAEWKEGKKKQMAEWKDDKKKQRWLNGRKEKRNRDG